MRVHDYSCDEHSHVELIRSDFALSRARSIARHNQHVVDRPMLTASSIVRGSALALGAVLVLLVLKAAI